MHKNEKKCLFCLFPHENTSEKIFTKEIRDISKKTYKYDSPTKIHHTKYQHNFQYDIPHIGDIMEISTLCPYFCPQPRQFGGFTISVQEFYLILLSSCGHMTKLIYNLK